MDLHQLEFQELDIECIVEFAEYLLSHLSRRWIELHLTKNNVHRRSFTPTGLSF